MNYESILSLSIGILGVAIAIYQGFEKRKLSHYLRSQAWYIYSMANMSSGSTQIALKAYRDIHKENFSPTVFEFLAKCEAYNVSLFLESIRQIQLSEPRFNIETIMLWQAQGKISKEQATHFYKMMSMDSVGMFALIWKSLYVKLQQKLIKQVPQPQDSKADNKPVQES